VKAMRVKFHTGLKRRGISHRWRGIFGGTISRQAIFPSALHSLKKYITFFTYLGPHSSIVIHNFAIVYHDSNK